MFITLMSHDFIININDSDLKLKIINIIHLKCLIRDELRTINIFNVLYILNAKVNLLSIS